MTLDINKDDPTIALRRNEIVVNAYSNPLEDTAYSEVWEVEFPFRYTVHRQHKGFFTPMVYDVAFTLNYLPGFFPGIKHNFEMLIEPYVEGALFVDDESPILPLMLKGQEAGINRKEMVDLIKSLTKYEYCGVIDQRTNFKDKGTPWYSDWMTPPPTIQSNRIYVYDMDDTKHGSRLDPVATCNHILEEWERRTCEVNALRQNDKPVAYIVNINIVAGYTEPVTVHKD